MNKITKILSVLALLLSLHVVASGSQEHEVQYLSANASIANEQMGQLKHLYSARSLLRCGLAAQGFELQPTPHGKYHLTLTCLNVYLAENVSEQQKKAAQSTVERILQQKVNEALNSEEEFNMSLPFAGMAFFKKHAVALFASNRVMDSFIEGIERNFVASPEMQDLIQKKIVTSIQPKQKERKLHVTIAKMACKHAVANDFFSHFSYEWRPDFSVQDIIVNACKSMVSVQARSYASKNKPITIAQEAPRKAAPASNAHAPQVALFSYKSLALCCLGIGLMWYVAKNYLW